MDFDLRLNFVWCLYYVLFINIIGTALLFFLQLLGVRQEIQKAEPTLCMLSIAGGFCMNWNSIMQIITNSLTNALPSVLIISVELLQQNLHFKFLPGQKMILNIVQCIHSARSSSQRSFLQNIAK